MVTKVKQSGIANDAVGAAQIQNDAVVATKIADGSVGSSEISDGSVGVEKLTAALDLSGKTVTLPAANTPALTKSHETAPIAFSSGALLTFAHAMGVAPKLLQVEIACVTGELNWVVGDRVVISCGAGSDSAANRGLGVYYDATNIYVRVGSAAGPIVINNKTSGATAALTPANWRLVVKAWA